MKNVKLILLTITTMLFLSMENASAQQKLTVIITGKTDLVGSRYEIEIINPYYEVEKKISKSKEDNFFASMKKEADFWLDQGYKLIEATSSTVGTSSERVLFVLIKEE